MLCSALAAAFARPSRLASSARVFRPALVLFVTLAVLIATIILPGGTGGYSLWGDATQVGGAAFATGGATIVSSDQPVYLRDGQPFDPLEDTLEPGQTLTVTFNTTVRASGTSMRPELELSGWTVPEFAAEALLISVEAGNIAAGIEDQIVPVTLTLSSHEDAVFSGQMIDFSAAEVTLKTGTAWSDTKPLTTPLQNIWLYTPIMQITYETNIAGAPSTIVVPVSGLLGVPVTIDWGDNSEPELVTEVFPSHNYSLGSHTVTIRGAFTRFGDDSFAVAESNYAMVSVSQWDNNGVVDAAEAFYLASNLFEVAKPPATLQNMANMFFGASYFNQNIGDWNVKNVTDMSGMFAGASSFDNAGSDDIGMWNVANVAAMERMFSSASAFARNLESWDVGVLLPDMPDDWNLDAPGLELVHSDRWPLPWQPGSVMMITYDTTLPGGTKNIVLPASGFVDPLVIDWGDNTEPQLVFSPNPTHTYPAGQYTATVFGDFSTYGAAGPSSIYFSNASILEVPRWGNNGVTNASYAFTNASNLVKIAQIPHTITNMQSMFNAATSFNQNIGAWNVANVTNMTSMFNGATAFNNGGSASINNWNTASLARLNNAFSGATSFNQPIGNWDVSQVTTLSEVFSGASSFNQDLGAWNVANVIAMPALFANATAFNNGGSAAINTWNTDSLQLMFGAFSGAASFNQPIGAWNVSQVSNLQSTFNGASSFNQDIGAWNVAAVTSMNSMFYGAAAFNNGGLPSIGSWDVSAVTNMNGLFYNASAFAQDISDWNVWAKIPNAPTGWNTGAPGLAEQFNYRWPFAWQPERIMQLEYNTNLLALGADEVVLPISGLRYLLRVNWGDGSPEHMVLAAHPAHEYATPGNYTVTVRGVFENYGSTDSGVLASNQALTAVTRWDENRVLHLDNAFSNATHLVAVATPPSTIVSTAHAFHGASVFNQNIGAWPVANVTDMNAMFSSATAFNNGANSAIGTWNVAKVASMTDMFNGAAAFTQDLAAWDVATKLPTMPAGWNNNAPGLSSANQARWPLPWQSLPAMQINFDTTLPGATTAVVLPVSGMVGVVKIVWGDGSLAQTVTAANPAHNYAPGKYTATIYGNFATYGSTAVSNKSVVSVPRWDANGVTSAVAAFYQASNFVSTVQPPLTVTNYNGMFSGASSYNQNIASWNTAAVTNMASMFNGASAFNQNIGGWNTANVTSIINMFKDATAFNQNIGAWNVAKCTSFESMFNGATAFNNGGSTTINNWVTTALTSLSSTFQNASSFNQPIGSWNVSKVSTMASTFSGASAYNQNIGGWNVAAVTNMNSMFSGAAAFNNGASATIGNWNVAKVAGMNSMFNGASVFAQNLANWNVETNLRNMPSGWNTSAPGLSSANSARWPLPWQPGVMVIVYDTTMPGATKNIVVPIDGYLSTVAINWGDGTSTQNFTSGYPAHTYAGGRYTATIRGSFTSYGRAQDSLIPSNASIYSVNAWNTTGLTDAGGAFWYAKNLVSVAAPPRTVTRMGAMFVHADAFDYPLNNWDVSSVITMGSMFSNASSFNQPLSNWDVSSVIDMSEMFHNASSFNQPLNDWDVSSVTTMRGLFYRAGAFNQPLNNWDVSSVTNMGSMFSNAPSFNQPLSNWDVSSVKYMNNMFEHSTKFDQSIGNWNVSKVNLMQQMFFGAANFKNSLVAWNPDIAQATDYSASEWNRDCSGLSASFKSRWPARWQ